MALVALVIFQGLLGMWTVTLLLKPLIVVLHLLGGLATFSLLAWLAMGARESRVLETPSSGPGRHVPTSSLQPPASSRCETLALAGLVVLVLQIASGRLDEQQLRGARVPGLSDLSERLVAA